MNVQSIARSAALALVAALTLAPSVAQAQSGTSPKFNVPFDFHVGDRAYPAGEYTVNSGVAPGVVLIRSLNCRHVAAVLTNSVQARRTPDINKLIFIRYAGAGTYLRSFWVVGSALGRELLPTKQEVEVARRANQPEETIVAQSARP